MVKLMEEFRDDRPTSGAPDPTVVFFHETTDIGDHGGDASAVMALVERTRDRGVKVTVARQSR